MDDPFEHVPVHIVEGEQLFCAGSSGICCPMSFGMPSSGPRDSGDWPEFHRSELIEADDMAPSRGPVVEFQNAVFFTSNSGSGDSFQVFVRWRLIPSLRSRRRTHSLEKSGNRPRSIR